MKTAAYWTAFGIQSAMAGTSMSNAIARMYTLMNGITPGRYR